MQRLTAANLHNDETALTEVLDLLSEIDSAWNSIPSNNAAFPPFRESCHA